jgi:putative SOS response-associated peptidase YedK
MTECRLSFLHPTGNNGLIPMFMIPDVHDLDALQPLMTAPSNNTLACHPVSAAVGNVRDDSPQLLEPIKL